MSGARLIIEFMPKSKGRKPKKKQARLVPAHPTAIPAPAGPGRYTVGRLRGSEDAIGALLFSGQAEPDLMVELLPPLLWLYHAHGQPANHCVDGCMVLHYAYEQLGITAQPRAVDLVASDQRTGKRNLYGRPDPFWSDRQFIGHCVLWLPQSGRIVDATVEQYPEVRRYRLGPICGRLALTTGTAAHQSAIARGELPSGTHLAIQRNDLLLLYTTVDPAFDEIVTAAPLVLQTASQYRRAGINLASHALTLLRLPEVVDRVRQAPYPRLHALLDTIATAPATADEDGDYRFASPGPDGTDVALRLDDVSLPALASAAETMPVLRPEVSHLITDPHEVNAVLEDVATEARAVITADAAMGGGELPVLVFEPLRAVGMRTGDGHTREAQAEGIISAGFARFLPTTTHPLPLLLTWSVRRTSDGVELWDHGGVWARATLKLDDDWLAAVTTHRAVQVIYGVQSGVRFPAGLRPIDYTPEQRAAELLASRHAGIVATARVPWTS